VEVTGHEEILRVQIQPVGVRISGLIGEEEKNDGETNVDDDFSHFDFSSALFMCSRHVIGVDWSKIEQSNTTLTGNIYAPNSITSSSLSCTFTFHFGIRQHIVKITAHGTLIRE
jgi:hypothetical protein